MKGKSNIIIIISLMLLGALYVRATVFFSNDFFVSATIVDNNSLYTVRPLSFGVIPAVNKPQKVIVKPTNNNNFGHAGEFILTGKPNQHYLATLKKDKIELKNGKNSLLVHNFLIYAADNDYNKPAFKYNGVIPERRREVKLYIGATLDIPKDPRVGMYYGDNTLIIYVF